MSPYSCYPVILLATLQLDVPRGTFSSRLSRTGSKKDTRACPGWFSGTTPNELPGLQCSTWNIFGERLQRNVPRGTSSRSDIPGMFHVEQSSVSGFNGMFHVEQFLGARFLECSTWNIFGELLQKDVPRGTSTIRGVMKCYGLPGPLDDRPHCHNNPRHAGLCTKLL